MQNEPEVHIYLSCRTERARTNHVVFNSVSGKYQELVDVDPLLHLLTLPSRVVHKEHAHIHRKIYTLAASIDPDLKDLMEDSRREMEKLYSGLVSEEEVARLDCQPNPFNFSERVSQTTKLLAKEVASQTNPPPSTRFSDTVGFNAIYRAYTRDQQAAQRRQQEWDQERDRKERDRTIKKRVLDPIVLIGESRDQQQQQQQQQMHDPLLLLLPGLGRVARVMERMVTQNIYDDISQG
ncbi:dynein intermediate chain 2, ciliary-like [Cherax quadricarinatus]|uniref:dynein intermediate chain 2, ciliary-like n=1 Tax=Cherax quadricarinatus TaxID=27406 RepID=UPI00387ECE61